MQKKKILLVSHKHPPSIGGMQKHFFELKIGLINSCLFDISTIVIKPYESSLHFLWKVRREIKKHLAANPITEAVYINDGLLACIVGDLARNSNVKFVATIHGLDLLFTNKLYQRLLFRQLNYFHKLIGVSHYTCDMLRAKGFKEDKIVLVLNGVDQKKRPNFDEKDLVYWQEKYKNLQGKEVLISIGRAVKRKGFSWFASQVMPHLSANVAYIMIGDIESTTCQPWYQKFFPKSLRDEYRLMSGYPDDSKDILNKIDNERIFHLGKLSINEIQYLLSICKVIVVPNITVAGDAEGFGLVALEGVMAGKLVVAADLQGLKSAIIANKNGLLVEPFNSNKWIAIIEAYLNDENMFAHILDRAIEYTFANFSWQRMVKEYSKIFNEA